MGGLAVAEGRNLPEQVLEHLVQVYGFPVVVYWLKRIAYNRDGQSRHRKPQDSKSHDQAYQTAVRRLQRLAERFPE